MDFKFTVAEENFRQAVRDWLKKEIPPKWHDLDPLSWEETDETWALSREFQRKLGQKGWLAPAYPKKYGGSELSHMERLVLAEELAYHRAPVGVEAEITVNWVGPSIMRFGAEDQKQEYIPKIAKGDTIFCLGYSEPDAGSDLASLKTRAVESGDEFVINGQKTWTSYGHYADYCWLAARTDPNVPKHKGISIFIVDMKTRGITVRPLINIMNRHSFNEVFFDDVRVPKNNLVGERNKGWYQLLVALDFERSAIGWTAAARRLIEELIQYAKETKRGTEPLAKNALLRNEIAKVAVENEVARMMCYRIASMYQKGLHSSYESSMSMVFASEVTRHLATLGTRVLGNYAELDMGSKWAVLNARMMRLYLTAVSIGVGGGTNEIQRDIVAQRGLGLPR